MHWRIGTSSRGSFPICLNDLGVRSLTGFFAALREDLLRHAPDGEAPLAVVLTPGSFNETYFEHAYLARQLGLPLVEGHDLTVRGDTLFLKTLGGLRACTPFCAASTMISAIPWNCAPTRRSACRA
jgi:uncharacterized circularly permuted ATP-grasp superfamily protein